MKHIIIEGPDVVGKDLLISKLCSLSNNYIVRHFSNPIGNTNAEKINYQKIDFELEFKLAQTAQNFFCKNHLPELLIWNRSHIGEYVYGQMYRNYDPSWIFDLEQKYNLDDVYLILLYGDPKFLIGKDDGESISNKVENRAKEINLFFEAFEQTHIKNKQSIKVNKNNEYLPISTIHTIALNFLKIK